MQSGYSGTVDADKDARDLYSYCIVGVTASLSRCPEFIP